MSAAGGAIFASLARNALASPDTLAVTAGAYFAVTVTTAPVSGFSVVMIPPSLTM